ncbi:MAG: glutathione S-transferase family protein [Pseudomonadales bacterium]|nr:glutathione S-transferase family protein [Pseudomonadales bacterium]
MIKVHGVCPSPFVRKVLTCLELKGLDYERLDVMPMATPEDYIKLSPLLKVPALEDGDFSLCDSSVICEYLQDQYPETATAPTDPQQKAKARWLEEYADSKLAELASGLFFERVLKRLIKKQDADEQRVKRIIDELLPPQLDYVESQVPENGYLFGEKLMLADIALTTHFINAEYAGYTVDADKWPKFSAFIARVKAHPIVSQRLAEEAEFMQAIA